MNAKFDAVRQECHLILEDWIDSCTRGKKVSRNTIAVGIVVLDHLRRRCPVTRDEVISSGGEVKGARSGLAKVLVGYGIPEGVYLKEATTRQVHQDGQRLFESFEWGAKLAPLPPPERDDLLRELIGGLVDQAHAWLRRQNLKLDIDRRQAPTAWVHMIVENAQRRSGGVVEQHLVGAKLARRFTGFDVPNFPAHAADSQTGRPGDFVMAQSIYHVTAAPSRAVILKCADNIAAGLQPVLLVPAEQEYRARALAQEEGIDAALAIISIEAFVAVNILELATEEGRDFFGILQEIVEIYNRRLAEVETDLSLQIEVR